MKTKELNEKVFAYILNAIDPEAYEVKAETEEEKLKFLYDTFKKEYVYPENVKRYGHEINIMREWLMGLPSAFNVDFANYRILEIAKEWGSLPEGFSQKQGDKILENWFNFIANKTFQLFKKYKIS